MSFVNQPERINIYTPQTFAESGGGRFEDEFHTGGFRYSMLTWITLTILLVLYPLQSFVVDPGEFLTNLNEGVRLVVYWSSIFFLWGVFGVIALTTIRERTSLIGIGFVPLRRIDFAWGIAGIGAMYVIASGLTWLLASTGIEALKPAGEIALLLPESTAGRLAWVLLSITAGVCEEAAFRGYLMTRLRILTRARSWALPVLISAVAFGACHAYQSLSGMIVVTTLGIAFGLLYIRTRSIWPGVIAHFFIDFLNLFIPQ